MTDQGPTAPRFTRRQTMLAGAGSITAAIVAGSTARAAAERPDPSRGPGDRPGRFERTTLWTRGENGWVDFRVHAVDTTPAGTILAFSEARVGASADDGPKDLVLRRSVDGCRTWEPTTYLERHDGGGWANPTPVVDRRTGRITVCYAWNDRGRSSRVFRRTSTDDGISWSDPAELTHLFAENPHAWTFHLPGPGRGIQLADGRLLVEVWHRRSIEVPAAERGYTASVIASDDGGRSWIWGGVVPDHAGLGLNEARIAPLATGEVIMNSRLAGGPSNTSRAVARSRDGGRTFAAAVVETNIAPHAGVTSGLAARVDRSGVERIVYSGPVTGTERRTMYARISYDGAKSWSWGRIVDDTRAGYSDLVWLDDGTLLLLYSRLGGSGAETLEVVAARFDLAWLTQGRDAVGTGPVGLRGERQAEGLRSESALPRVPMIIDPAAAGSAATHIPATAANDAYRVSIVPADSGRRRLRCRFRAPGPAAGADVVIKVDGQRRGGVVNTSAGDPFLDVDLGMIMVRAGRPVRLEFLVHGPAPGTDDHAFQLDTISLLPPWKP